jgi:transcriptional regulator with XRE-family HTH domain
MSRRASGNLQLKRETRRRFAKRLRAARIAAGYETMADFADRLGMEADRYRRYEAAQREPDLATLAQIAAATGASLDALVAGTRG